MPKSRKCRDKYELKVKGFKAMTVCCCATHKNKSKVHVGRIPKTIVREGIPFYWLLWQDDQLLRLSVTNPESAYP